MIHSFKNFQFLYLRNVPPGSRPTRSYYGASVPDMLVLSAEEEKSLFQRYAVRRTAAVREKLVRRYLCWAYKLATKMHGPRLEIDDAISAANVGLMEAIESFDVSKGSRFTTHSYFVIRRHIIEALVGTYPVHVSQHIRKKMKMQPVRDVETEHSEDPRSLDELFERLGESTDFQMHEMYERPEDVSSISPPSVDVGDELSRKQTLENVRKFVDTKLEKLERQVFIARHYRDPAVPFERLCTKYKTTKFVVREAYRTALEKVQKEFKQ